MNLIRRHRVQQQRTCTRSILHLHLHLILIPLDESFRHISKNFVSEIDHIQESTDRLGRLTIPFRIQPVRSEHVAVQTILEPSIQAPHFALDLVVPPIQCLSR
ncbi:hypothetical protein EC957_009001 [Mortierella hygrophila]|uniref:Uncharacterized protein n=1 Tax=Mortierella hygrophila TaxID=979708 RepID=A0A9P6FC34_9FUNG|nr:hypothetical protein EC957_009001 [Mortierella hygrophila]